MAAKTYAVGTDVSVAKTRAELDDLLQRFGATSVATFVTSDQAAIAFEMEGRRIIFRLQLPEKSDSKFWVYKHGKYSERRRTPEGAAAAWEAACRQKWRALLLSIKAKLVSVEENIETMEQAFMAHVVMPDGRTISEHVQPRIAAAYREQKMVPLLPGPER